MRITKYKTMLNDRGLPELVKEKSTNYAGDYLTKPETIVEMMQNVFQLHRQTEEFMYVICFSAKLKPIGVFEISHGTINTSMAQPREIFQKALICGAAMIAVVHNHPSGDTTPSQDDQKAMKRIMDAGKLIGVELVDSIIIGDEAYYSFHEYGWENT